MTKDRFEFDGNGFGILGHGGEYKPRFGLWLDTSPECQNAVKGLLSEGYECDVVLKYRLRCPEHRDQPHRPVIPLSTYARLWPEELCKVCYLREVFFPEQLNLRRQQVVKQID